jgi:hypothetical protein
MQPQSHDFVTRIAGRGAGMPIDNVSQAVFDLKSWSSPAASPASGRGAAYRARVQNQFDDNRMSGKKET